MKPFRIDVAQAELDGLRSRIAATRWPAEPVDAGWSTGVPVDYLRQLADYWREEYDWRAAEAEINGYPQYTTEIDGATIHFLHVRSAVANATPLLLTNGWPGSFVEFLDVIGPLTDPEAHGGDAADAFHVVLPSLPGYGFSGPLTDTGWDWSRIAQAWAELMSRLGYTDYVAQGGDFGAVVALTLAAIAPERVRAAHVNMLFTAPPSGPLDTGGLTEDDLARHDHVARFIANGTGYMAVQATRPRTLAYALTDSPVGQLAWIVEKFREWTDSEKVPEDAVSIDRLLTNVSVYWFTRTAGSSARMYHEFTDVLPITVAQQAPPPLPVPLGVAVYPRDPIQPVRAWAEQRFPNIIQWTEQPAGGHFPAMEQPELFVADLWAFHRKLR